MAIDYGLDVRQAAINNFLNASARKASAKAEADARERKAARQKRKGLMSLALHAGAAVATGGASIPYSMKYGAMANQALMGDDYQGSDMQALQGLGSMVYQGAEANKMKNLAGMEKAYNGQLDSIYKAIDALPPGAKMERARLANQAANLTTTFQKNLKAAEAKPVWEFASSERERMQAKSLGEVADKGQKAYDDMYTNQAIIPQKVKEAEGSTVSNDAIDQAYSRAGARTGGTTPAPVPDKQEFTRYDNPNMLSPRQQAAKRNQFNQSADQYYEDMLSPREKAARDRRTYERGFLPQLGGVI
tara:strand:- start:1547 stop:2455 length:909 start_codon:yes stop_codon:yes gene_type:complete